MKNFNYFQAMSELETTQAQAGKIPEPVSPQSGVLGLTEELAMRAFRELPHGGDKSFSLLQELGLDKPGSSPESTVAATAVIRLARDKIAKLVDIDDQILPENKPASFRVNLKHLLQIQPNETPQQRFAEILKFVLSDNE